MPDFLNGMIFQLHKFAFHVKTPSPKAMYFADKKTGTHQTRTPPYIMLILTGHRLADSSSAPYNTK